MCWKRSVIRISIFKLNGKKMRLNGIWKLIIALKIAMLVDDETTH